MEINKIDVRISGYQIFHLNKNQTHTESYDDRGGMLILTD